MVGSGLTIDAATGKLSADSSNMAYNDPNKDWKSMISDPHSFSFNLPDNSVTLSGQLLFAFRCGEAHEIFGVRLSNFSMPNLIKKTYTTGYIDDFSNAEVKPVPFNLSDYLDNIWVYSQDSCYLSFPSINGLKIAWKTYYSLDTHKKKVDVEFTLEQALTTSGSGTYSNPDLAWADLAVGTYLTYGWIPL